MTNHFSFLRTIAGLVAVLALVSCGSVQADEPKAGKSKDLQAEVGEEIDLFDAVKQGKVETRFVAHNANRGNLLVRNLTKNPLNIRVPDAFGAVPVMKQFGGGMGGMGGMEWAEWAAVEWVAWAAAAWDKRWAVAWAAAVWGWVAVAWVAAWA